MLDPETMARLTPVLTPPRGSRETPSEGERRAKEDEVGERQQRSEGENRTTPSGDRTKRAKTASEKQEVEREEAPVSSRRSERDTQDE